MTDTIRQEDGRYTEPCDTLYINAAIATMATPDGGFIPRGYLAVKDGIICGTGPMDNLGAPPMSLAGKVINCSDQWILPGFVDCHTHMIWAGSRAEEFRMRLAGATYEEISKQGGGIFSTVRAVRETPEERLYDLAKGRLNRFLRQGVTCVEIKSGYGLDTENELKMLAVAGRLSQSSPLHIEPTFLGAHALPPEFAGRSDDYVSLVTTEMLPAVVSQGIATAVDVFCEGIAFSRKQTQMVFQAAADMGFRVKLHAEQLSNSDGSALAARFNALSCDHLEYLSRTGAEAMAARGVTAVLLPGAFHYLKETRKPPIEILRELNIPMALSTDINPGTSPVFGLTPIMNMGCLLFDMTCEEALAGVTIHGARALGLENRKGSLETGKDADLVIWDIDSPADLCYFLGRDAVDRVVISGKTVYHPKPK
ncbi:MAG: imidazolonepropionase [Desulfobacterales bacterium]|nr:imidazolonepropionase [Desulfobacterales bacterium]